MLLLLTTLIAINVHAGAPQEIAHSEKNRVRLIELFTSEGCSSCPPADAWISKLKEDSGLWKDFVPVAFHVDYWNSLGWKDRFSFHEATQRQMDVAQDAHAQVYTPGVFVDAKEYGSWRAGEKPEAMRVSPLGLSILRLQNGNFQVIAKGLKSDKKYHVQIAELGMGLKSEVSSGENSGRTLQHNFVALSIESKPISAKESSVTFVLRPDSSAKKHALAVWVEEEGNSTPLQAAGAYVD